MADRGEPDTSCLEWHGDGTSGEDHRASHVVAEAPARPMGEAVQVDTSLIGKDRRARGSSEAAQLLAAPVISLEERP